MIPNNLKTFLRNYKSPGVFQSNHKYKTKQNTTEICEGIEDLTPLSFCRNVENRRFSVHFPIIKKKEQEKGSINQYGL